MSYDKETVPLLGESESEGDSENGSWETIEDTLEWMETGNTSPGVVGSLKRVRSRPLVLSTAVAEELLEDVEEEPTEFTVAEFLNTITDSRIVLPSEGEGVEGPLPPSSTNVVDSVDDDNSLLALEGAGGMMAERLACWFAEEVEREKKGEEIGEIGESRERRRRRVAERKAVEEKKAAKKAGKGAKGKQKEKQE